MNAELLIMFTLDCNRAYLYAHPERELAAGEIQRYDEYISRRATGVPAQYITGHQEFWGLDLIVNPSVLIPRPETEHIIEVVTELARKADYTGQKGRPKLVDVGTGSGAIAVALAKELPQAQLLATQAALEAQLATAQACTGNTSSSPNTSTYHAVSRSRILLSTAFVPFRRQQVTHPAPRLDQREDVDDREPSEQSGSQLENAPDLSGQ